MGIVINQFAPLTNRITASVLDSMWEGVVMAAVAWLLLEVIKRLNAATRFVIWSGVMVCVGTLSGIAVVNGFQTKRLSPSATGSVQNRASDLAFPSANELALANGLETQRGSESQTQSILLGESLLVHLVHQAPAVPRVLTIEGGVGRVFYRRVGTGDAVLAWNAGPFVCAPQETEASRCPLR